MAAVGWVMSDPRRWSAALRERPARAGCWADARTDRRDPAARCSEWTEARDLPRPPKQTFRDWWVKERER